MATGTLPLVRRGIWASRLALGCMGLGGGWNDAAITGEHVREAEAAIEAALEVGINFFDHADIYKRGKAEAVFGQVLRSRPDLRSHILIQTKCGIRPGDGEGTLGRYDFSREHILRSVDGSLSRLGVECLDVLLLHRPDPLMDGGEVAEAFSRLNAQGKVRHFGVSNMSEGQIRYLQSYLQVPLIANQLELSLRRIGFLETGVHVNQAAARDSIFPDGTLEFCRMENIQIQAWGPLAKGYLSGRALDDQPEAVRATARLVAQMAAERGVPREAIVVAWLLAHPAAIQPIIGTKTPERIRACAEAERVELSREDWYALYVAARGRPLP
jgi:predicted oxidoreductase